MIQQKCAAKLDQILVTFRYFLCLFALACTVELVIDNTVASDEDKMSLNRGSEKPK